MACFKLVLITKILFLHLILRFQCQNPKETLYDIFSYKNLISNNHNNSNTGPTNNIDNYINNMKEKLLYYYINIMNDLSEKSEEEKEEAKKIYDLVTNNTKCSKFILYVGGAKRYFINLLAIKLLRGGIISNAIGLEDECLGNDEVYMFISGEYPYNLIKENLVSFSNEHILFIESLIYHEEICLWKFCYDAYQPILEFLINYDKNITSYLFTNTEIKIEGTNYYINKTKNKETYYNKNNDLKNDKYIRHLKSIIIAILILIGLCTLITILMENKNYFEDKKNYSLRINTISIDSLLIESEENFLIAKEKTYKDDNCYKFMVIFNVFKNFLLLNEKKEQLSNQNSLVELSLIRLIIILLIILGENTYIILKYVDKGRSLVTLTRSWSFSFIIMGCISYEYYKIICGIIFGFKFINYYYKSENFGFKRITKFIFKFIPYLIIFFLLYFGLNYPEVKYVKYFWGNIRNNYISKKMNECYCMKNFQNIFEPINIISKYNDTSFNIGQYNGCFRSTLFTISEFFSYLFILFIVIIFLKIFKSKILELLFFIINFIYLCSIYFLTKEVKDIKGEYTLSRFFGLSSSMALPYLFFPLYYIGFNIGIIYFYYLNESETYARLSNNNNNYIPFEYCYKISIILGRIHGKIKNAIIIICILLMVFLSSFYYYIMHKLDNNKLIFNFEDEPLAKYMYVYEGTISGLLFSIFILIYLTTSSKSIFKIALSSELFIFGNKISFVLFNSFYSILRFFHGISILEIYLSTLYLFRNALTLFTISNITSIIIVVLIFYPVKWIYFFILNGAKYEYNENAFSDFYNKKK